MPLAQQQQHISASTKLPCTVQWLCNSNEGQDLIKEMWPGCPSMLRNIVLEAAVTFVRSCRRTLRNRHRPLDILYPATNEVFHISSTSKEEDDEHHHHRQEQESSLEPPHLVLQKNRKTWVPTSISNNDMDLAALIIDKDMFIGLDKRSHQATDYVCCPITRGIDDLDEKDPRYVKLFFNDVLLHECIQHMQQVVRRLMLFLGPLEWTTPPCTPRAVAAWNKLLQLDDCFIAPHVPSSVELQKNAETDPAQRIERRVEMLAVQRTHADAVDEEMSPLNRVEHYEIAVQVENDATNAKKDVGGIKYAPRGVLLVIANGMCDEDVVTCADVNRVLGRLAVHTFLQLHAHHVRALDVRSTGLVHTGGGIRNVASSLILRSLRLQRDFPAFS